LSFLKLKLITLSGITVFLTIIFHINLVQKLSLHACCLQMPCIMIPTIPQLWIYPAMDCLPFWPCSILMTTPNVFPGRKFNICNMLWQCFEHLKISVVTVYWNFPHKIYVLFAKDTCVMCEEVDRFVSLFQIWLGFVFVTIFLAHLGLCCDSDSVTVYHAKYVFCE
jgi:hypothetical protein